MHPEIRKRVHREAVPLQGGVERVRAVCVARADTGLAPQGVVRRARQTCAPFRAGVEADLADHINDRGAFAQHDCIVAVEPTGTVGLIGLCKNGRTGGRLGDDVHVAVGDRPREVDGQASGGTAIEEHLDIVAASRQVDGNAGAVVDFQCFVVAGPLDIL